MGQLSFGECEEQIQNAVIYEGEFHKMNIFEFHNAFHFWIHMGEGSHTYAEAMAEILAEYGVASEITENIILKNELEE